MNASPIERRPFLPPPPGQASNLFSLYVFPIRQFPHNVNDGVDPWFRQFLDEPGGQVRNLLRREWANIQLPSLRIVAEHLLTHKPRGVLYSSRPADQRQTWLVMSRLQIDDSTLVGLVSKGTDLPRTYYLPAPLEVPDNVEIDATDTEINFFLTFGGLRQSPPFQAGHFYALPQGPTEIEPDEWRKFQGTIWEDARAVFISDTGDELLVASTGQIGWLLHDSREIKPLGISFEEFLIGFPRYDRIDAFAE